MREQWSWRGAFILAVIGSAVGLGNIWRFPYVTYANGGGAFLIPYLVALLTAGIPLMMLEFSLGKKFRRSAPLAFASIKKKFEFAGWLPSLAAFVIICYYGVVMGWAIRYIVSAFNLAWGEDTVNYFLFNILKLTDGPGQLGSISWGVFFAYLIGWLCVYLIIYKGVKGIGKVVMVTATLPVLIVLILVFRGITLPGAAEGLTFFLQPNFAAILQPQVWLSAYGQVFFSLSLAMGILIAYSSYLPDDADISNNVFITAFADAGIAFLAGLAVFSTLGYMALSRGVAVTEVVGSGVILAFAVIPQALNLLPGSVFFAVLFFLLLTTFAIDSQFSLVESSVAAIMDKFNLSRSKAVAVVSIPAFLIGILFVTGGGLYWLDIVDRFINNYGLVIGGLLACIIVGHMCDLEQFRVFINSTSEIKVGKWFNFCIKYLTPAILIISLIRSLIEDFTVPYEGYPFWALFAGGWLVVIAVILLSFVLMKCRVRGKEAVEEGVSLKE